MKRPTIRELGRGLRTREDGAVILETAIMLTILLLFMFGIFDTGRVLYTMNGLTSAAREGARAGAVDASCANIVADTRAVVRSRFSPFGGSALTDAQITVTVTAGCIGGSVRVAIAYPFNWITPLPRLLGWTGSSTTVHATAEYKYEL